MNVRAQRRTPSRVVAIACMPRSGSNLLAAALDATGRFGRCEEMVNSDVLHARPRQHGDRVLAARLRVSKWLHRLVERRWSGAVHVGRRAMLAYLRDYPGYVMSDDGVFASKHFWHLYRLHLLDHGLDLHHWGAPVTWIRLVRRDRLAQAVSHVRASQTRQWRNSQPAQSSEQFDEAAITTRLEWMCDGDREWDDYFARTGEPHLVIDYADLDCDYTATMRRVLDHLGFPDLPVPPPQLQRQRNATSDEWIARYRTLHPEYRDPD